MAIISIQRDQNNTISIVRMQVSDTLATVSMTDYILNNQPAINALNGGTWQWFITDMILVAAEDGNAFYEFVDTTFATIVIFGQKGTGTVNPGLQNNIPYYAANGNTLSPLSNLANAILATNSGSVPGLTQTLPSAVQANISTVGTIGTGIWQGSDVDVPFGGTGVSSFTAYSVICGGTTSTGPLQNVSGLGTSGYVLTSNGAGALPTWQASAGSGTVSPGTANDLAFYQTTGNTVSPLTSAASGVLVTSGLGVPSISQTLPSAVQLNITNVGTLTAGTWNAGIIGSLYGGTGLASPTAHGIMIGEGSSPMTPIVLSSGQVLIGSTGADPVAAAINSGTGILVANGAGSITVGLAAIASHAILSNITSGSAAPIANTLTATIDAAIGSTQGNILYRNSSAWVVLAPGTSGQFLTTGGAAANVSWTSQAGTSVTFTGDAGTPFSGAAVTLTGGTTGLTFTASTPNLTLGGTLGLTNGGTNHALTASAGGIVWSDSTKLNILSGTSTAGQLLLSGNAATPSWSTSTYPSTNAANTLLYASSANTMAALATANSSILATSAGGVPAWTQSLPTAVQVGVNSLNSGTSASSSTFWRGDGTWAAPAGSGTVNSGTTGQVAYYASSGTAVSGESLTTLCKAPTVQIFTSGSGTYTTPSGPTPLYIRVKVKGSGGAGAATGGSGGGGGGEGGYCESIITSPAASYTYAVGAAVTTANDGNASTFSAGTMSGGGGRTPTSGGGQGSSGGKGGTATGGNILNLNGAPGNISAFEGSPYFGGSGGGSGGGVGAANAAAQAGQTNSGGGGGGGDSLGNTGASSGSGLIIVEEYYQ